MDKTQLVVFSKEDIRQVLTDFNFRVQKKKIGENRYAKIVVDSEDNPATCPSCKKEISVKKVGTIAHGSRLVFCDNPLCFATWVANNKIQ